MTQPDHADVGLLLEADPIIGVDPADVLEVAGNRVDGPVRTAVKPQSRLGGRRPALAVLGVESAEGAPRVHRRGVPILVRTEQADAAGPAFAFARDSAAGFTDVSSLSEPGWRRAVVWTMGERAAHTGGTV